MSDSLKEQLVALGLASEKPRQKSKKQRARKGRRATSKRQSTSEISLDEAYRQRAKSEKESAEETRRRKREEDLRRRELNTRIQPIVDAHKLNDPAAELKRNFMYKGRIRSVLVTPDQLKALNAGELGLVFLRGSYFVMPPNIVEQVQEISADHVPDLGTEAGPEDEDHPVPDDLVW